MEALRVERASTARGGASTRNMTFHHPPTPAAVGRPAAAESPASPASGRAASPIDPTEPPGRRAPPPSPGSAAGGAPTAQFCNDQAVAAATAMVAHAHSAPLPTHPTRWPRRGSPNDLRRTTAPRQRRWRRLVAAPLGLFRTPPGERPSAPKNARQLAEGIVLHYAAFSR